MAKVIDEKIESINIPWEGYAGSRVEEFIKEQLKAKYGYFNMRFNEGESMYYIECFNTQEDYLLYESGKELEENPYEGLLLQNVRIPISTVQDDVYTAFLRSSEDINSDYAVIGNDLFIKLNYRAVKLSKFGNENAGYDGTLIIENSINNGASWQQAGVIPNALRSKNYDDETEEEVNIGPYLSIGRQAVRLRATYTYVDTNGVSKVATSANVNIGKIVTKTNLSIELARNFEAPIYAYDNTGKLNYFPFDYKLYGAVDKTLHVKIFGAIDAKEYSWPSSYTEDGSVVQKQIEVDDAFGFFTHGVRKVEAWLTCEDGRGNTITSNKLVNRFMVVNITATEEIQLKPYLLLQGIENRFTVTNFVQKEFCQYAIYNPVKNADGTITNTGGSIELAFLLTDYAADYEETGAKEYFRIGAIAEPGTQYSLITTAEIEQEGVEEIEEYETYFRVRRIETISDTETESHNFMEESTAESYYSVVVDNRGGFAPILGATFFMNPKIRSNNEEDPAKIYNVKNNNAEVTSEFINFGFMKEKPTDGWMINDEDNQRVLRILAGSQLKINYNPFKQFVTAGNRASSMTIEIDFRVSNVTNETDPLIFIGEGTADNFKGIKMNALDGWIKTANYNNDDDCLFSWKEGRRTHIAFNLNYNVRPNLGDIRYPENTVNPNGTTPLARVLVNGSPDREIPYTDAEGEWCTNVNNQIIIGNEGADIDIYAIRIYENKALDLKDILIKNRIASLPTAAEKEAVRKNNSILAGDKINVEAVKALGKNCLIWHGDLPYNLDQSSQTGWYEVYRYDVDGNPLPEYSGTICKETKSLKIKGQGSTAKTYWDWNQQDNQSDVEETIQVALADFHESIHVRVEESEGLAYIYGGNLGKNFPIEDIEVAYPYSNGYVTVPDGWIDGNNKYRGMGYQVAPNTALAQKKVIKINYASSMQNHLIGACNTYNLLQKQIHKSNSKLLASGIQEDYPDAVCAKMTEPFMYFAQPEGTDTPLFKGMGNYGAGKMDKVAWGYVKKLHPMFAMIEGADNNMPLCDFRVPFDHTALPVYDDEGKCEGWSYADDVNYDIDAALLDDNGNVDSALQQKWADIHNFVYLHSTNLKYFVGSFNDFKNSTYATNDTVSKYWCTQGDGYQLYRYDFVNTEWVPAGLWDSTTNTYKAINLKTDIMTKEVYEAAVQAGTSAEYATMNKAFINAIVEHGKKFINYFVKADWLQFNYVYVLHFLAGTDNASKNTYYVIDPKAKTMDVNDELSAWFLDSFGREFDYNAIYQMELHGDDMDSILKTNNNAHQTKPYYIDRMHPYKDDDETTECLYEGSRNALFNFCEAAYEEDRSLQVMMKTVMIAMTDLVNNNDYIAEKITSTKSLWGFLHKYFFNIQNYFPEIAYIEQNRIRYEFPHMIGFVSTGAGTRSIAPISQALGRQLDNELQYMEKRLVYMASYAAFGEFTVGDNRSIGLDDVGDSFGFTAAAITNSDGSTSPADYIFNLTPHQYIYPIGFKGQSLVDPHVRAAAGKVTSFTLATGMTSSDTGLSIAGINYYTNLGNFSDKSIRSSLSIKGKRLTILECLNSSNMVFIPTTIDIQANNLKIVRLMTAYSINVKGLTNLTKAHLLTLWNVREIEFPLSNVLKDINLAGFINIIKIIEAPNLSSFVGTSFTNYIREFIVGSKVGISVQDKVEAIYTNQQNLSTPLIKRISVDCGKTEEGRGWTNFPAKTLEWFIDNCTDECTFKGTISIAEPDEYRPAITWDLKNKIIATFGNVDNPLATAGNKGLILNYLQKDINTSGLFIRGNFYPETENDSFVFEVRPQNLYENSQTEILYSVSDTSYCTMNRISGILKIKSLSNTQYFVNIRASISSRYEGVGRIDSITKTIELWNRPAQVGDYVYADGTYADPKYDNDEKTVIGVCIYTPPRDADGNINETFFNKNDKQQRLMVATRNVSIETSDATYSSLPWGAYPIITDDEEVTLQRSLFYTDSETGEIKNLPNINTQSIYDIAAVANITTNGLVNTYYITEESFIDYAGEGIDNDGFKPFDASTAVGDGFAYKETEQQRTARTLDSEIWNLTDKNTYAIGDIVNSGYAKTLEIIAHRNMILNNGIEIINLGSYPPPSASGSTSELQSLGSLMKTLKTWATDTHQDDYPNKWMQLAYPAASACYAYQPTDHLTLKIGEVLADKFKSHNWFLPTQGILARIYWHSYGENNIFADIPSSKFAQISTSGYWSSSEYYNNTSWSLNFSDGHSHNYNYKSNSIACRAVAAF